MRSKYLLLIFVFLTLEVVAQSQGKFRIKNTGLDHVSMPFELVNNMVVIKASVNGKELSFILDTGINRTMIFNLKFADSLYLRNVDQVKLRGLGEGNVINAIRSHGNRFEFGGVVNPNISLFVITDDLFDLSAKMGIDIHGIIGGDIFKDFIVRMNYSSNRLTFFDPQTYEEKKCRKCEEFPLDFYNNKPFIDVVVENHLGKEVKAKLLIDSGGGDALWLFPHSSQDISIPEKHFDDYLGKGLNGNIYGKRSKIPKLKIGRFEFENAAVSYPDSTSIVRVHANRDRNGTLGAEILKRFIVDMDYPNRRIILKKNGRYYGDPFLYNKSGIEFIFGANMLVSEKKARLADPKTDNSQSITEIIFSYGLTYKPSYRISEIRKGSPAHLVGLMVGDIILEVNGTPAYSIQMDRLVYILSQKEDKKVRMLIDRNGEHLRYEFYLKSLL